jgi:integrase
MSTNEIRELRLGDFNLQQRRLTVPPEGSKNRYRQRTIPIVSPDALWALEQLLQRAREMGARDPQHYLFPFKVTRSKQAFSGPAHDGERYQKAVGRGSTG